MIRTTDLSPVRASTRLLLASAAVMLAVTPAMAQKTGSEPANTAPAGGAASGGSSGADDGTNTLNREQAAAARAQNAANSASANTYNAATADYQAARNVAAEAQARYEREMQAHRDAQAAYDAAYARWQADVAACQAGDHSRCGAQFNGSGPN